MNNNISSKKTIAIIGMAGIFPGAYDIGTFWNNILNRVDTACKVPGKRWIANPDSIYSSKHVPDKAISKTACLINDFKFKPEGINIQKELLEKLDPLHLMALHTARDALKSCNASSTDKNRIGTILAAIALPTDSSSSLTRKIFGQDFEQRLFGKDFSYNKKLISREESIAARVTGLPAAIISQGLGLGGGSFTLDAACASSIFAVKLACDELDSHRADLMLAGGISRPDSLYTQVGFSQLKALSPTGRCAPFDESGDGLVVGEGAGILILKRLDDAIRDKDTVHALIHATGISNDIAGDLLSPDINGQIRAMEKAYKLAGWSPMDIDYIECHGTGTPVGDTTELRSLSKLWGSSGWKKEQCPIGSVKSMIGHLLTGAGAAGMIKIVLALKNSMLPPSINFNRASDNSPLISSPFRVQTEPEKWEKQNNLPMRAAVSAFGFGGTNGHILLSQWQPETQKKYTGISIAESFEKKQPDIAITGMESVIGSLKSLRQFQETVLTGKSIIDKRPENRWKGKEKTAGLYLNDKKIHGAYLDDFYVFPGEFRIPPMEIPDILLQHMLMLKVSAGAMKDAGLIPQNKDQYKDQERHKNSGVIIGINFDFETTNFNLRWDLENQVQKWQKKYPHLFNPNNKGRAKFSEWLNSLKDAFSPPLTNTRTLGALGSIIASRIAREFGFGGMSFTVSNEEASGMKALEIAMRALQRKETDTMLVGAVDLCGDVRKVITSNMIRPFTKSDRISPFDISADGTLPGEGAVALVLKRLTSAKKDKDRIYAVIKGAGSADSGGKKAYTLSLKRAFQDAQVSCSSAGFFETHGSGNPKEDNVESEAINEFFQKNSGSKNISCAIGSVKPNIGNTGAVSGLASIVKTGICLYQQIIPPLVNFSEPLNKVWAKENFYFPVRPQYWFRDRKDGPRIACTGSITSDGNCLHTVLEEYEYKDKTPDIVVEERKKPLGSRGFGLFIIEGDSKKDLHTGLDYLKTQVADLKKTQKNIDNSARDWHLKNPADKKKKYAVSIVAKNFNELSESIDDAKNIISSPDSPGSGNKSLRAGNKRISFSEKPLGGFDTAFVFPGSGNHFPGMGRGTGVQWPEIMRNMDAKSLYMKSKFLPECYMPQRVSWASGWEKDAKNKIASDPLNMILGQVAHGCMTAEVVKHIGIKPDAAIGYSLGESASLFATGAWPESAQMLGRMKNSDLFSSELAGECRAARRVWEIPEDEDVNWCAAVVNRSAQTVLKIINKWPTTNLLIINTPDECVIGGRKKDVDAAISRLECEAIFLEGVVAVHCKAAKPVEDAYRKLHIFPITPPTGGIKYYSCYLGRSYDLTSESAAYSICGQAVSGFDFTKLINQAYDDGIRIFLEMGPQSSCTRMIKRILNKKPHMAVSASVKGEDDYLSLLKFIGSLVAERFFVDLNKLYEKSVYLKKHEKNIPLKKIWLTTGGLPPDLQLIEFQKRKNQPKNPVKTQPMHPALPFAGLVKLMEKNIKATSDAHLTFLEISQNISKSYAKAFAFQNDLLKSVTPDMEFESVLKNPEYKQNAGSSEQSAEHRSRRDAAGPAFSREMCMEFATGSLAKVFGPEFKIVDTYKARVRLPDEPLMLVDKIISIKGKKGSMGSGVIITEHDVLHGAWYLDGGRAPVCISVEAGQADLFLCSYLGIDLMVKGKRNYRLLDATVEFHSSLPRPGDIIRYEIKIEKFIKQDNTYLFFFSFEGAIGKTPLISMTNGSAGFFTKQEVINSGGIILTDKQKAVKSGKKTPDYRELVPVFIESYDDKSVKALRSGELAECFGDTFKQIKLCKSLRLPGGQMKLIDRILSFDPYGGRFKTGIIRAEADIHPDDWFLTCHFQDDMVMPGTLMYECCSHALRVFLQRMGWVTEKPNVFYEPVAGIASRLKCRGPVTPSTKHVIYEIHIKEIGYTRDDKHEPYAIADAHMFSDSRNIVFFENMSLKINGITRDEIESFWEKRKQFLKKNFFNQDKIIEFACGKPSKAFGEPYSSFDKERKIARLPAPPYSFIHRITHIEPEPFVLKPGGWITAEYDLDPDAWYLKANRTSRIPFSILLEIALQPCGWLAAFMGSALKSKKDLKFRNLGGSAIIYNDPQVKQPSVITTSVRLKRVSNAGEMIIEQFEFQVFQDSELIYKGDTSFGFFTKKALAAQKGIQNTDLPDHTFLHNEHLDSPSFKLKKEAPFHPDDPFIKNSSISNPVMPSKAMLMIDTVDMLPHGGHKGLGFIRGVKKVDPDEWFFKAHFYQDPVVPGSLGIEGFIQLLKFFAVKRWKNMIKGYSFEMVTGKKHNWQYRGQITPSNKKIEVEAYITDIQDEPLPSIIADGLIKVDGLYIYIMENFGIRLVKQVP